MLSFSRTFSLALSQAFVHPRTHPFTSYSHTYSFSFSLSYFVSLSLSLWCVRASMRACPSLLLSFAFALAFSLRLSVYLFLSLLHIHLRTRSHTLSLHPLTHKRTRTPNLYPHLARSLTHISLSSSLFLSLSLVLSLSLSLSLLHTYTDTHTHSHSHTLLLIHSLIHSFIVVACARCVVFSTRSRARSLLSVSLPLHPVLIPFLCNSVSFALFLPSRSLASSPSFSHSFASSLFQLLVAMIIKFNLKQSCSYCILLLSCPWRLLLDGTVEENNRGRDKLMRKDRDVLVPAVKFPYMLSYATDGSCLLQIGSALVCR